MMKFDFANIFYGSTTVLIQAEQLSNCGVPLEIDGAPDDSMRLAVEAAMTKLTGGHFRSCKVHYSHSPAGRLVREHVLETIPPEEYPDIEFCVFRADGWSVHFADKSEIE